MHVNVPASAVREYFYEITCTHTHVLYKYIFNIFNESRKKYLATQNIAKNLFKTCLSILHVYSNEMCI